MAKDPQWRKDMAHADALLRPYPKHTTKVAPLPSYVTRWLHTVFFRGQPRAEPGQFAARILTEACCSYYRLHAPALPFPLVRGVAMDPPGFDAGAVAQLGQWAVEAYGAAVFNGAFAWLFEVKDDKSEIARFRQWVAQQWTGERQKKVDRAGWPVIVLETGDWPLDIRLIPGTPVAFPRLTRHQQDLREERRARERRWG